MEGRRFGLEELGTREIMIGQSIYLNTKVYSICLFDTKVSSFSFSFRRHAGLLNTALFF